MTQHNIQTGTPTTDAVYHITSNRGYRQATDDAHHLRAAVTAAYVARRELESLVTKMSAHGSTALGDLCAALDNGIAEMRITQGKVANAMETWVSRR